MATSAPAPAPTLASLQAAITALAARVSVLEGAVPAAGTVQWRQPSVVASFNDVTQVLTWSRAPQLASTAKITIAIDGKVATSSASPFSYAGAIAGQHTLEILVNGIIEITHPWSV